MRFNREHFTEWAIEYSLLAVILTLAIGLVALVREDSEVWWFYALMHDCEKFSDIPPIITASVTLGGKVTTFTTEGKSGYRCNDGTEHWR